MEKQVKYLYSTSLIWCSQIRAFFHQQIHHCIVLDKIGYQANSFLISRKNICCGYSLEVPQRGASNEYPQHMFLSRSKKNIDTFWLKKKHLIKSYATVQVSSKGTAKTLIRQYRDKRLVWTFTLCLHTTEVSFCTPQIHRNFHSSWQDAFFNPKVLMFFLISPQKKKTTTNAVDTH